MIHLYGLKTCDTCRKALKTLEQAGYAVTLVDVRADGVTPDQLAVFHGAFGTALVNTRSTTWRGLSEAARGQDPLTLLAAHPALMKRPVIERAGVLTLGWGKDVQAGFTT